MRLVLQVVFALLLLMGLARFVITSQAPGDVLDRSSSGPGVVAAERSAREDRPLEPTELSAPERVDLPAADPVTVEAAALETPTGLWGRVVDRSGRAVQGAKVELVLPSRPRLFLREGAPVRPPSVTYTDAEGGFTLALQGGRVTSVVAWHAELGTAQRTSVRTDVPRDLGVLHLRERGVIAGRIVYPDGRPVRFLEYQLVSHVIEPAGKRLSPFAEADHRSEHGGVLRVKGRTDTQGRFRGIGLTPGEYSLNYGVSRTSHGYWRNSQHPILTGDVSVSAELDAARILVRVTDSAGLAHAGFHVGREFVVTGGAKPWPSESPFPPEAFLWFGTDTPVTAPETGFAEFWAAPGYSYLLSAELGEQKCDPVRVDFPPGLYEFEVVFELPSH